MGIFSKSSGEPLRLPEQGPDFGSSAYVREGVPDIGGHYMSWLASKGLPEGALTQIKQQVDALRNQNGWISGTAASQYFDQKKKTTTVLHYLSVMSGRSWIPLGVWASESFKGKDAKAIEEGASAMQKAYGDGPAAEWALSIPRERSLSLDTLASLLQDGWSEAVALIDDGNEFAVKEFRRSISNWADRTS